MVSAQSRLSKKAADVEVDYPIEAPASFARHSDRLQRRLLRPVSIGVGVEMRLHQWLQVHCDHRLGNTVCNRRYAQHPLASVFLRYRYYSDRRREVRA